LCLRNSAWGSEICRFVAEEPVHCACREAVYLSCIIFPEIPKRPFKCRRHIASVSLYHVSHAPVKRRNAMQRKKEENMLAQVPPH
jgi:hypothetical protein